MQIAYFRAVLCFSRARRRKFSYVDWEERWNTWNTSRRRPCRTTPLILKRARETYWFAFTTEFPGDARNSLYVSFDLELRQRRKPLKLKIWRVS